MKRVRPKPSRSPGARNELPGIVALALTVSGAYHVIYYQIAPWIWSQNLHFAPEALTPWIRGPAVVHDGVETFALYILMFAVVVTLMAGSLLVDRVRRPLARTALFTALAASAAIYCVSIGFTPPMNSLSQSPTLPFPFLPLCLAGAVFVVVGSLYHLDRRAGRWGVALAAVLLAPACLVASTAMSWFDYSYMFAPALRLLNGAGLRHIYFQYDLFLSLLAAGWMKLGLDLNAFQLLGRGAYFVSIFGIFLLARKWFANQALAFLLLAALVLGRLYASPYDTVFCFQVTPLRLDLWLVVIVAVYALGPYHWAVGAICGALIIVHNKFGIIYSLAYVELLATLAVMKVLDRDARSPAHETIAKHGRACIVPLAIMAASGAVSVLLFRGSDYPHYSDYYQKIGIGFIPIEPRSFYWYVPAVISSAIALIFRLRRKIPAAYMTSGLLLAYCAIGNSIYFFGRSHDNNILNLALVLLFLFFVLLDLTGRFLAGEVAPGVKPSFARRYGAASSAAAVLLVLAFAYSETIVAHGRRQLETLRKGRLIQPVELRDDVGMYVKAIRRATGNSDKLYFIDSEDFTFYYYGGYRPVGYPNPFLTWIFSKDLTSFLQKLLDDGYYVVCSKEMGEVLAPLSFGEGGTVGRFLIVSNSHMQAGEAPAPGGGGGGP